MKCPNCNGEVPDGKRFCGHCGQRLIPIEPPPAPADFDDDAVTRVDEGTTDEETPTTLAPELEGTTKEPEVPKVTEAQKVPQKPKPVPPAQPSKRGIPGWVWGLVGVMVAVALLVSGVFRPSTRTVFVTQVVEREVTQIVEVDIPTSTPMAAPTSTIADRGWVQYKDSLFLGKEDMDYYEIALGTGDFRATFDVALETEGLEGSYVCPYINSDWEWRSAAWTLLSKGRIAIEGYNSDTDEYLYYPDWKNVAAINTDVGETNRIEIVAQNNSLAWFINGELLAEFDYPTTDSEHIITWQNCEPLEVSVENIFVEELP